MIDPTDLHIQQLRDVLTVLSDDGELSAEFDSSGDRSFVHLWFRPNDGGQVIWVGLIKKESE